MKKLHDKHGDNFDVRIILLGLEFCWLVIVLGWLSLDSASDLLQGMVRDVKLNPNQYTKKHLKKKIAIYLEYYKEKMAKQAADKEKQQQGAEKKKK